MSLRKWLLNLISSLLHNNVMYASHYIIVFEFFRNDFEMNTGARFNCLIVGHNPVFNCIA